MTMVKESEFEMEKKSTKNRIVDIIIEVLILLLSAALCVGVKLIFHACGQTDEGKWMACHWAEQAVAALGGSMTLTAVMLLCMRKSAVKLGLSLALIPQAAAAALIPNTLINLCMMETMRCHTTMKPAVIVISVITAICAGVCAARNALAEKRG